MKDYFLWAAFKAASLFLRLLPVRVWLFLARGLGGVYYYFCGVNGRKAYAHLRRAFPGKSPAALKKILKQMYRRFAQNAAEVLYLPYIDEKYLKEHIRLVGAGVVQEALESGRGIIFLGVHAGSWELSNLACACFFKQAAYAMLVHPQSKFRRTDDYLNRLREAKGCRVIGVGELKKMVAHLSGNHMLGLVADHGGKDGLPVEFFSKLAMTPQGSVKLAQKLGSKIVLAFMRRVSGPDHEMFFRRYELVSSRDGGADTAFNLRAINRIFEEWIALYPQEYWWPYKRWKYSPQVHILVLSDGKAGHLKQSLGLAEMIQELGLLTKVKVVEVEYKNNAVRVFLSAAGILFGAPVMRFLLAFCLKKRSYQELLCGCDYVISTGAALAAVNLAAAAESQAKSIAVMKPGVFPLCKFDVVVMPRHDNPPARRNCIPALGSLHTVGAQSLRSDFEALCSFVPSLAGLDSSPRPKIGLLLGGDSRNYVLAAEAVYFMCQQVKKVLEQTDGLFFLTTSRRTSPAAVEFLSRNFKDEPRCRLFVEAGRQNPDGTVGGILYLSDAVIVSGESISMVSEAAASGKYTMVFEPEVRPGNNKVKRFLDSLADKNFIYLLKLNEIYDKLIWVLTQRPGRPLLDTRQEVLERLKQLL